MTTDQETLPHKACISWLIAGAVLLTGSLMCFCGFAGRSAVVSMVSDDAYYYLNVAKHLATSGMSSFDGITLTTGYHPLYTWLLSLGYAGLHPSADGFVRLMLCANLLFHVLTAVLLFLAGSRLHCRKTGCWAALLFLVNPYAALWPLTGMEASLNGFLVTGFFVLFLQALSQPETCSRRTEGMSILAAGGMAGLAVLARIDNYAVACVAALVLFLAVQGTLWRRVARAACLLLIPTVLLLLWFWICYQITGEWLQGSARMKGIFRDMETGGFSTLERFLYTSNIFLDFVTGSLLKVPALKVVLIFTLPLLLFIKRESSPQIKAVLVMFLTFPVLLGAAYALKLPGVQTWYYVPSVLGLTLVSALAVSGMPHIPFVRKHPRFLLLFAGILLIEGVIGTGVKLVRGRNIGQRDMLAVAESLSDHVSETSRIGAWNAGIYSYYSDRTVINLDGLINDEIYASFQNGALNWPYWLEREIDYLVDRERFFQGIAPRFRDAELQKVNETEAQFGDNPIVLYRIVRSSEIE